MLLSHKLPSVLKLVFTSLHQYHSLVSLELIILLKICFLFYIFLLIQPPNLPWFSKSPLKLVRYTKCSINFIILKRFLLEASEELQFGRQKEPFKSILGSSLPLCFVTSYIVYPMSFCFVLFSWFIAFFFFFGGELFCIACWEMRHGREIFFL